MDSMLCIGPCYHVVLLGVRFAMFVLKASDLARGLFYVCMFIDLQYGVPCIYITQCQ